MPDFDIGPRIGIEGEAQFKQALSQINSNLKTLRTEMQAVTSQYDKNDKSVEALTAKNKVLTRQTDEQRAKLEALKAALHSTREQYGENDKITQKWQQQVNSATAELNKMERELTRNEQAMKDLAEEAKKKALDDYAVQAKKLGETANNALNKGLKVATTACVALRAAAVAGVVSLGNLSKAAGEYADELLTTAAKTRISAETLQEWGYAARFIDTEVETMTGSMAKMIRNMESARQGSKNQSEAFKALGISVTDAQGQLRDSETVFFEAIDALGRMTNETQRDAIAMQIFGKSAQELNPLISAGSSSLKEYAQEARNLGLVLSNETLASLGAFDDTMQRVDAQMDVLGRQVAVSIIAPMTQAGGSVSTAVAKISQSLESGALKNAARNISAALSGLIERMADTADRWIPKLADGFVWLTENGGKLLSVLLTGTAAMGAFKIAMSIAQTVQMASAAIAAFRAAQTAATAATTTATVATTGLNAALNANPIMLVVSLVAALVAGIVTYSMTAEKASKETDGFNVAMQSAADTAEDAKTAFADSAASTAAAADMATKYIERLGELQASGLGNNAAQAEYAEIVKRINALIPDLNAKINEQTGLIEGGTEALRRQVQAWKDNAIAQATQEQVTAAYKAHAAAAVELYKAESQLDAKQSELTNKQRELAAVTERIANSIGLTSAEFNRLVPGLREQIINTSTLGKRYNDLNFEIDALKKSTAEWQTAIQSGTMTVEDLAAELDLTTEAAQKYYDELSDGSALESFADNAGIAEEAAYDLAAAIESMSEKTINGFERIANGSKISIEKMIANLDYNAAAMQNWADNLKTLVERGVDEGLLAKLQEMGPEARLLVQEMVDATDEELSELERAFTDAGEAAAAAAQAAGANAGNAFASGISATIAKIKAAARNAANAALGSMKMTMQIESPSKRGIYLGEMTGEGFAIGIENKINRAASAAQKLSQGVISSGSPTVASQASGYPAQRAAGAGSTLPNITSHLTINANKTPSPSEIIREEQNAIRRLLWNAER